MDDRPAPPATRAGARTATPYKALIKVGYGCNEHCTFCHTLDVRPIDGSSDEVERKIQRAAELGHAMVVLSGGEPTIRPELLAWAQRVAALGLDLGLVTNGRALAYRELVDRLVALRLRYVYLSLHGGTAAVHRLPRDLSGARTTIVTGTEVGALGESVRNFVVDDTSLYVLANNNNLSMRVRRRAKDGSGAVVDVVTPQQNDGLGLASDASCLYYCSSGKAAGQTNKVWGVSKAGSNQTPNVIVADAVSCLGLGADATHLYYAHSGKIWKVAK